MGRILIKYPSRQRPEAFLYALDKYVSLLSGKHEVNVLISADWDDKSMCSGEIQDKVSNYWENGFSKAPGWGRVEYGRNTSKIMACNADIGKAGDWDVVLLASDDMIPEIQDYDDIILTEMQKHFPDTDGALFFNDGTDTWNRNLCTISILGRKYYERFGYIYYPGYKSFYCDNEHTEIGQALGKLPLMDQVIIRNISPDWGGSMKRDKLYEKNNKHWREDERLYKRRKSKNFGLNISLAGIHPPNTAQAVTQTEEPQEPPLLSILIPTLPERHATLNNLLNVLRSQSQPYGSQIEILVNPAARNTMTIGAKRHSLYQTARGKYAMQLDDDDGVPPYFIDTIMEALQQNPDCLGYYEICVMNGQIKTACHSNRYPGWADNVDGFDFVRTPYFKDIIRADICRQIPVPDIRYGEDQQWSAELKRAGLIQNEVFLNTYMYLYSAPGKLSRHQFNRRYGK